MSWLPFFFSFLCLFAIAQKSSQTITHRFLNGRLIESSTYVKDTLYERIYYYSKISNIHSIRENYIYENNLLSSISISQDSLPTMAWKYFYSDRLIPDSAVLWNDDSIVSKTFFIYNSSGQLIRKKNFQDGTSLVEQFFYNDKQLLIRMIESIDSFEELKEIRRDSFLYNDRHLLHEKISLTSEGWIERTSLIYNNNWEIVSKTNWINDLFIAEIKYVYDRKQRNLIYEYEINNEGFIVRKKKYCYNSRNQIRKIVSEDYRRWGFEDEKEKKNIEKFKYDRIITE